MPKKSASPASSAVPVVVAKTNLWFGVTMLLVGFIAGSVAMEKGESLTGWLRLPSLPSQEDTPPAPPAAPSVPSVPTAPSAPAAPAAQDTAAQDALIPDVDPARDHIRGNANADVAVIEYSDLECPFCKRVHPTLEQLISQEDDVQWVYRHFPLGPHKNARKAAEAVECAGKLGGDGKLWEMIAIIYEKGTDNTKLVSLATEIGLRDSAFATCLNSGEMADRVQEDMDPAEAAGINGTPSNFVVHIPSGRIQRVMGARPIADFLQAIENVRNDTVPAPTAAAAPAAAVAPKVRPTVYTVPIRATDWAFTPSTFTLKKGDTVKLRFVGAEGEHGVSIPGLGISKTIAQGQTVEFAIPTDKTGTFPFSCNVACGTGHSEMTGVITIEE
jgi:protein-disulfide isomerase